MRIRTWEEQEWLDDPVIVKRNGRKAHIVRIPAERVGFSANFLHWITYDDADRSLGVVDVDLEGTKDIEYVDV